MIYKLSISIFLPQSTEKWISKHLQVKGYIIAPFLRCRLNEEAKAEAVSNISLHSELQSKWQENAGMFGRCCVMGPGWIVAMVTAAYLWCGLYPEAFYGCHLSQWTGGLKVKALPVRTKCDTRNTNRPWHYSLLPTASRIWVIGSMVVFLWCTLEMPQPFSFPNLRLGGSLVFPKRRRRGL